MIASNFYLQILILFFSVLAHPTLATTILRVDVDYLLEHADLVFEGEVIENRASWDANHTGIVTYVTFIVQDIIKGAYADATIELSFAGGTVGGTGMRVGSMVYPDIGEKGVYFVENPRSNLVSPLVGWSQGHFLVVDDEAGIARVVTNRNEPVVALDFSTDIEARTPSAASAAQQAESGVEPFSHGVARGISVGRLQDGRASALNRALDRETFKDKIKLRLTTSGFVKAKK